MSAAKKILSERSCLFERAGNLVQEMHDTGKKWAGSQLNHYKYTYFLSIDVKDIGPKNGNRIIVLSGKPEVIGELADSICGTIFPGEAQRKRVHLVRGKKVGILVSNDTYGDVLQFINDVKRFASKKKYQADIQLNSNITRYVDPEAEVKCIKVPGDSTTESGLAATMVETALYIPLKNNGRDIADQEEFVESVRALVRKNFPDAVPNTVRIKADGNLEIRDIKGKYTAVKMQRFFEAVGNIHAIESKRGPATFTI